MIIIICGGNFGCWRDADDDGESQFKALRDFVAAANPATISELIDRLETAEKERDALRSVLAEFQYGAAVANDTIKTLQAKIEAMEQQEPVAEIGQQYTLLFAGSGSITGVVKRHGLKIGDKLYALPGAQPAPSVPDVDALAQVIREVDGSHQLGAGVLAERIAEWLKAAPEAKP